MTTRTGLLLAAMLHAFFQFPVLAEEPPSINYQKKADVSGFTWTEAATKLNYYLELNTGGYKVSAVDADPYSKTIIVKKDGSERFRFEGHNETPFIIKNDVLFYISHNPGDTGCTLVAVDLKEKSELWKTSLKALGPIDHFKYSNRINMDSDDRVIVVQGFESAGKYLEYVDMKTGKTVGNKIFTE